MERPHDGASARPSAYASQGNVGSVGNRSDKDKRLACLTSRQQRSRPLSPGFVLLRSLSVPLPFAESSPVNEGSKLGITDISCERLHAFPKELHLLTMEFREDWSFFFFLSSLFAVVTSNVLADHILRDPETAGHLSVVGTIEQLLDRSPADGADQGCNSDACFVSVESLLNRRKWIRGFSRRRAGWSRRKGLNCSGRHNLGAINFRCPKIPQNSGACWTRTSDQRIMSPPL